ncbi:MAG: hypothetical protein J6K64_07530 [Clostridia bacterium]|nr:hypothetical protein [Clostridia bacterium]
MPVTAWEVKEYLGHLTVIEESVQEEVLDLCRTSLREIEARLKSDADRNDVRIASAAAALAFYKMLLKKTFSYSDEITSFKAGDVSITQNTGENSKQLEKAEKLYSEALKNIIPLCTDNSFAFENIKIQVKI